ncbi:MAG: hypothetical protein M3214_01515 [Actinomycetota bacterium]|nr:hypothetical protein [Actinomycetota bacterium]
MTRRVLVTFASVGLVLLIVANVVTALSASNALPPTRADDDTVIAPPPESMLLEACSDSGQTDTDVTDPIDESQPTPDAGCPEGSDTGPSTPQEQDPCGATCAEPAPESDSIGDAEQEPCGEGCEETAAPLPEGEASPPP